jgi:hypothetical protein
LETSLISVGIVVLSAFVASVTTWTLKRSDPRNGEIGSIIQIKNALQNALIPLLFPELFNPGSSQTVLPEQDRPDDTDVPHVLLARFPKTISAGDEVNIVFRVYDSGLDLITPSGVKVKDHNDNELAVQALGVGFLQTSFRVRENDRAEQHRLTVILDDIGEHRRGKKPNHLVQTLPFSVTKPITEKAS